jgi:hypothetical protein
MPHPLLRLKAVLTIAILLLPLLLPLPFQLAKLCCQPLEPDFSNSKIDWMHLQQGWIALRASAANSKARLT